MANAYALGTFGASLVRVGLLSTLIGVLSGSIETVVLSHSWLGRWLRSFPVATQILHGQVDGDNLTLLQAATALLVARCLEDGSGTVDLLKRAVSWARWTSADLPWNLLDLVLVGRPRGSLSCAAGLSMVCFEALFALGMQPLLPGSAWVLPLLFEVI